MKNDSLIRGMTIDVRPNSNLVDDGLLLEETIEGFRLKICITYPKEVTAGSDLDKLAFENAVTNRDNKQVKALFASEILEKFSLTYGKKRVVLCFDYEIDRNYSIINEARVYETIFINSFKTSYQEAAQILCRPNHSHYKQLQVLLAVAKKSWQSRIKANFKYNKQENWPKKPEEWMRVMVAELMNLANRTVGKFLAEQNAPAIYRNCVLTSGTANYMLKELLKLKSPLEIQGNVCSLGINSKGHACLGFPSYLTLTSPLWRYVDMVNQRIFCYHLFKQGLKYQKKELLTIIRTLDTAAKKTDISAGNITGVKKEPNQFLSALIRASF